MGAAITGLGIGAPEGRLTNAELAARTGVSEEWIVERTGIYERRIAGAEETTSTLAVTAATQALELAGLDASVLDAIVVATITPDMQFPASACLVQAELGAHRAAAWDVAAGCSGFLFALAQVGAMVEAGAFERVLVCGADTLSRVIDYADARSCVLFGDGAGAVVVERVEGAGDFGRFTLRSDGSHPELLWIPPGGRYLEMQGREVYKQAVDGMAVTVSEVLSEITVTPEDRALLVAHQANGRILEAVARRLDWPPDRVVMNIDRYGNTSSASIPLALSDARSTGQLDAGDLVVMTAFGAGFAWGAGSVRWRIPAPAPAAVGLEEARV